MHSPTDAPAIAASANGVSNTRPDPNSAWRPSVMRNTAPSRATSSPNTSTRSSSRSGPAGLREPRSVAGAGIEGPPPRALVSLSALRRGVGGGMAPDPVGPRLDQRGRAVVAGSGDGFADRLVHGEHVVAVHLHAREAV